MAKSEVAVYDLQMEGATLGSALCGHAGAEVIFSLVSPDDFFSPVNRQIFEAAHHVFFETGRVDVLLLKAELEKRGVLDKVGGPHYLIELADTVATASNAAYYGRSIREMSKKRALRHELITLADQCANGSDLPDIVRRLESLIAQPQTDEGWLGKLGKPVPWGDLQGPEELPWLVEKMIARGLVTLFVGSWKAGKTTYLAALLHHVGKGGLFAGLGIERSQCLVVSEESPLLWKLRFDEFGGHDAIRFWCQPFVTKPTWPQWESFIADAALHASKDGYDIVIFDTMPGLWPIEDENNSTELIRAILPMKRFTKAGIGVVLVHHARRGNSNVGDLARGGGGLLGQVDHIVELRAFTPDDVNDKRRIMSFKGRLGVSERVIEWRGGAQFAYVGDKDGAKKHEIHSTVCEILKFTAQPMSPKQILDNWPVDDKPSKRTVERLLKAGVESGDFVKVSEEQAGKYRQPATYSLPQINVDFDPFAFDDEPEQGELFGE